MSSKAQSSEIWKERESRVDKSKTKTATNSCSSHWIFNVVLVWSFPLTLTFMDNHLIVIYLTFLEIFTIVYKPLLVPLPKKLGLNRLLHSGICEKQTSGSIPFVRGGGKPQAQVGTVLSASACDPVNVPHHTTSYTNWQPEPPLPLVTCSLATAIALSNRQVTWVGHTLTALTLPHPHLLLPLQTGLRSLEERIPHLGERFEGSTPPRPSHAHSHWVQMWLQAPYFLKFMTKIGHINPNLLLPVCALV